MSRHYLYESEHILLTNICNEYWREFGQLVAKHLQKAPAELRDHLLVMIEERSSAHGSNYEKYLPK